MGQFWAKVTRPTEAYDDNYQLLRYKIDDIISGGLAQLAVSDGWAKEGDGEMPKNPDEDNFSAVISGDVMERLEQLEKLVKSRATTASVKKLADRLKIIEDAFDLESETEDDDTEDDPETEDDSPEILTDGTQELTPENTKIIEPSQGNTNG